MVDFLSEFTPEELEIIKAQNGKFSLKGNELHFDDDLPDDIIDKLTTASIIFHQESWAEGNAEDHREIVFSPEKNNRKFLELFGLTEERKDVEKNIVIFDDTTAQLLITHKDYSGALLPMKNKHAYIVEQDKQLRFTFDDEGEAHIVTEEEQKARDKLLKVKQIPAKCADTDLLMTLASAVKTAFIRNNEEKITVDLPSFAKAMGVQFEKYGNDPKKNAHYDFWGKIKQLENISGVLVAENKILSAFKFYEYNGKDNTLTFASPYLYSLMDLLQKKKITSNQKKNNIPLYDIEGVSYLVSAKINHARSKVTAQVIQCVIVGLFQHGIRTDASRKPQQQHKDKKLITKSFTYKELIKCSPLLKEALQEAEPKRRNQILKRAIFGEEYNFNSSRKQTTAIEEYLREFTDAFNYWKDLTITAEPVAMKSLDNKITFSHHGINAEFEDKYHIPHVKTQEDIFEDS